MPSTPLPPPTPSPDPSPLTFLHYRVMQGKDGKPLVLGRGGFGVTYKAVNNTVNSTVALKIIHPHLLEQRGIRGRFGREARAAAKIRHRNIAQVHYLETTADNCFYAMDFVDGETIEVVVAREKSLPWRTALGYVLQAARALMAMHAEAVVHRDIKPANLMLATEAGEDGLMLKVIDFGLAKLLADGDDPNESVNTTTFCRVPKTP